MPVKPINSFAEFQEIINSDKLVVIDFWAEWCGPCRAISPHFEKFSDDNDFTGVEFYKVNVDDQEQISLEVGIKAMPTFQVYKAGNKVKELVGGQPAKLKELLVSGKSLL